MSAQAASAGESWTQEAAEPLLPETAYLDEYIDEAGDRRIRISEGSSDDGRYEHGLPHNWFSWRKLWLFTGPGFLMSIAYLVRENSFRFCWTRIIVALRMP